MRNKEFKEGYDALKPDHTAPLLSNLPPTTLSPIPLTVAKNPLFMHLIASSTE
jgi:hypothetical protein